MEAPEKIFLLKNRLGVILSSFCVDPDKELDNIEYIRKDAFIEKACKFFELPRIYKITGMGFFVDVVDNQMIEDFKMYMKGE